VTIDGQVGGIEINKYQAGERVRLLPFPIFVPGWEQSEPSRENAQRRSRQTFDETLAATPRAVFVHDQEMNRRTKMIGNPGFARDLNELRADPVPGLNVTGHRLGRRNVDKGGVRVRAAQLSTGRIGIGWRMKACGKSRPFVCRAQPLRLRLRAVIKGMRRQPFCGQGVRQHGFCLGDFELLDSRYSLPTGCPDLAAAIARPTATDIMRRRGPALAAEKLPM
jgi:hypothetical protein